MAFAHYLVAVPIEISKHAKTSIFPSSSSSSASIESLSSFAFTSSSLLSKARNLSIFPRIHRIRHKGNFFYYCFDFDIYYTVGFSVFEFIGILVELMNFEFSWQSIFIFLEKC